VFDTGVSAAVQAAGDFLTKGGDDTDDGGVEVPLTLTCSSPYFMLPAILPPARARRMNGGRAPPFTPTFMGVGR
jgi:hypothetical protein